MVVNQLKVLSLSKLCFLMGQPVHPYTAGHVLRTLELGDALGNIAQLGGEAVQVSP